MFVLTEVVLQRAIDKGLYNIKNNPAVIDEIFQQFKRDELSFIYGDNYINSIKEWVVLTKIPIIQSWSFDPTKIPCITIHLGSETEDESKASIGDYFGQDDDSEIRTGAMNVTIDIGIHADKSKDNVLWLYYIVSYIIYKEKMMLHNFGLQLVTFGASEYNKDAKYMAENIWTRWIRFKCVVQNYVQDGELTTIDSVDNTIIITKA